MYLQGEKEFALFYDATLSHQYLLDNPAIEMLDGFPIGIYFYLRWGNHSPTNGGQYCPQKNPPSSTTVIKKPN